MEEESNFPSPHMCPNGSLGPVCWDNVGDVMLTAIYSHTVQPTRMYSLFVQPVVTTSAVPVCVNNVSIPYVWG